MKISVVVPTHRRSYSALARAFEVASLDPARFEVVVRDNSVDERKREVLRMIQSDAFRLIECDDRGAFENSIASLRAATGEFVLCLADDDWLSLRGMAAIHRLASQALDDRSVGLITGTYVLEMSDRAGLFRYAGVDVADPVARLRSYFSIPAPNVLYYSAVRRDLAIFCFEFLDRLPYKFSFHDQLLSLLYLSIGRVLQVENVVYSYDLGEWETAERSLAKDRAMYEAAGLPPEIDRLHWLLCAMEGGFLLNSQMVRDRIQGDRNALATVWFANMFDRFRNHARVAHFPASPLNDATLRLREKWVNSAEVNLNELLFDVSDVLDVSDRSVAQRYFQFWSSL